MLKQVYQSQIMPYAVKTIDGSYPVWVTEAFPGVHYAPNWYWAQDVTRPIATLMGLEAVPKWPGSDESWIVQFAVVDTDYYPSYGVVGWVIDGRTGEFRGHMHNGILTASAGSIQGKWIKQTRAGKFWYNFDNPVFGGLFECTFSLDDLKSASIIFTGPSIDKASHFAGGFDLGGEKFMCVDEFENIAIIVTYATPFNHISVHNFATGTLIRHIPVAGTPLDVYWEDPKHAYVLGDNGMMTLVDYTTGEILSVMKYDFEASPSGLGNGYRSGFNGSYDRVMKKFIFCTRTPNVAPFSDPSVGYTSDVTVPGGDSTLIVKGYVDISMPERLMKPVPLTRSVVGRTTQVVTRLMDGSGRPMHSLITASMSDTDGVLRNQIGSFDEVGYCHFAIDCKRADDTTITINCTTPEPYQGPSFPLYTLPDGSKTDDKDIYAAALTGSYINDIGPHSTKPLSTYHPIVVIPQDAVNVAQTDSTVHYEASSQGGPYVAPMLLTVDVTFSQRSVTAQKYDIELTSGVANSHWIDVCWSEALGKFVAIARLDVGGINYATVTIFDHNNGVGWDGMVMSSEDGETWHEIYRVHPTEGEVPVHHWYRIVRVDEWNLFIVQADVNGYPPDFGGFFHFPPKYGMTSPDGEHWTANDNAPPVTFTGFVYVPEWDKLVAVGNAQLSGPSPTHVIGVTANGIDWTRYAAPSLQDWRAVAWSPSLGKLVAVSSNGLQRCMTSTDGEHWTLHTVPLGVWNDVAWSPTLGKFVAVSGNVSAKITDYAHAAVMTSTDGENWTVVSDLPSPRAWERVLWVPERNRFVASGGAPNGYKTVVSYSNTDGYESQIPCLLMESTNGTTWNEHKGVGKIVRDIGIYHSLSDRDSGLDAWEFHARLTGKFDPTTTLVSASSSFVFVTDGAQYGVYDIINQAFTGGILPPAAAATVANAYRDDAGVGVYGTKLYVVNSTMEFGGVSTSRTVSVVDFINPSVLTATTSATSAITPHTLPPVANPVVRGIFIEERVYFPQIAAFYNVQSNVWVSISYPGEWLAPVFYRPVLVFMDGNILALGGTAEYTNEVNTGYTRNGLKYDVLSDTWELSNNVPPNPTGYGDDNGYYSCVTSTMSAVFLFRRGSPVFDYISNGYATDYGYKTIHIASHMPGTMRGLGCAPNQNRIWFAPDQNGVASDDWLPRANQGLVAEYTQDEISNQVLFCYSPVIDGFFTNYRPAVWHGAVAQYGYGPYYDRPYLWDGARFLTNHNLFYRNVIDLAALDEDLPRPVHPMVSTTDGETYVELAGTTDGDNVISQLVKTNTKYVMSNGGFILHSADLTSWTRATIPGYPSFAGEIPFGQDSQDIIAKMVTDGDRVIALRQYGEIMSSNDNGVNWTHHRNVAVDVDSSGLLTNAYQRWGHTTLAYNGSVYITTEVYAVPSIRVYTILHISDGDSLTNPFTEVTDSYGGLPLENVALTQSCTIDGVMYFIGTKIYWWPASGLVPYPVGGPCVYRTPDGDTWEDISPSYSLANLTDFRSASAISIHKLSNGKLVIGGDNADWSSSDNGATWTEFNRLEWPTFGTRIGFQAFWGGVDNGDFILMMICYNEGNEFSNVGTTNRKNITFDGVSYSEDPTTHYSGPDSRERAPAAQAPTVMPGTDATPNPHYTRCAWSPALEKLVIITSTGQPNRTQDMVMRPNSYTMSSTTLTGDEVTRYFFRTRYDILVEPDL